MANKTDRPNILWICTDQQRYDTIGALGNEYINTPSLDRLVGEGVAFDYAYCQSPICTPSRASFLTGMYPSSVHGCVNGNAYWSGAAPLVTRLLADAGYDCGLAGKLHIAGAEGRVEPRGDDGYRVFHWSHGPRPRWDRGHAYADWLESQGASIVEFEEHPTRIPPELHQTTWCSNKAIEFMQEERDSPWLMSVNIFDPHPRSDRFAPPQAYLDRYDPARLPGPLFRQSDLAAQALIKGDFQTRARPPEEFNAREVKAAYYGMVGLIDENVGRMLAALEESGQRDNTIVIFMSDHGETLGDHGLILKGCRFYEGLVRVPLIISWPERFRSGLISKALVELTDIAPTLLAANHLDLPGRMQGRSLLPLLSGDSNPHYHREFVRSEYYHTLSPKAPARSHFNNSYATMIRDERYKLVVYHGFEPGELFDLEQDPGEFDNLWDHPDYREVRYRLMKQSFDALAFAVDLGPEQNLAF